MKVDLTDRRSGVALDGVLVINKPAGWTSHDIVARARTLLGMPKVGHTGTLDPAATGVLVLCLGKATRIAEYLMHADKAYRAVLRLGVATDTQDATGTVTLRATVNNAEHRLWPGRFVNIRLVLSTIHGAVLVPATDVAASLLLRFSRSPGPSYAGRAST